MNSPGVLRQILEACQAGCNTVGQIMKACQLEESVVRDGLNHLVMTGRVASMKAPKSCNYNCKECAVKSDRCGSGDCISPAAPNSRQ